MATTLKIDLVVDDNGVIDIGKSSGAASGSSRGFAELTRIARQTLDLGVKVQQTEDAFRRSAKADFDRYYSMNQKLMEQTNKKLDLIEGLLAKSATPAKQQQAQQQQQKQQPAATGATGTTASGKSDTAKAGTEEAKKTSDKFDFWGETGKAIEQSFEDYIANPTEYKWETLWEKLRKTAAKEGSTLMSELADQAQKKMFDDEEASGGLGGLLRRIFSPKESAEKAEAERKAHIEESYKSALKNIDTELSDNERVASGYEDRYTIALERIENKLNELGRLAGSPANTDGEISDATDKKEKNKDEGDKQKKKAEKYDVWGETGKAIEQSFEQFLMDPMAWKWETLWENMRKIAAKEASSLVSELANLLQQQIFGKSEGGGVGGLLGSIFGSIGGWFGGLFGGGSMEGVYSDWGGTGETYGEWHTGGIVGEDGSGRILPSFLLTGASRFHGGLAPDEFPAVLQRGEWVLPKSITSQLRGGFGAGGAGQMQNHNYSITINAVDSKSFDDMVRRNPGSIVGVVDTNLKDNGALRQTMKRTVK